jgi:hypothetical protein
MPFHVSIHSMFEDGQRRSSSRSRVSASGAGRGRRLEYSSPMPVTRRVTSQTAPIELTNHLAGVVTGSMFPLVVNTRRLKNSASMSIGLAAGTKSSCSTKNPTAV